MCLLFGNFNRYKSLYKSLDGVQNTLSMIVRQMLKDLYAAALSNKIFDLAEFIKQFYNHWDGAELRQFIDHINFLIPNRGDKFAKKVIETRDECRDLKKFAKFEVVSFLYQGMFDFQDFDVSQLNADLEHTMRFVAFNNLKIAEQAKKNGLCYGIIIAPSISIGHYMCYYLCKNTMEWYYYDGTNDPDQSNPKSAKIGSAEGVCKHFFTLVKKSFNGACITELLFRNNDGAKPEMELLSFESNEIFEWTSQQDRISQGRLNRDVTQT